MRPSKRFIAFVDDAGAQERLAELLGRENVVCVSRLPLGPGVLRAARGDRDALFAECRHLHERRAFSGVIQWHEQYVIVATELARHLGLPTHLGDPWIARDKLRMRQAFEGRVASPQSVLLREGENLDVSALPPFPCILKPRYGCGSICAIRVDDEQELVRELREKRDKLVTTRLHEVFDIEIPTEPDFLCEAFVGGSEHSVESLVVDGEVKLQLLSDKLPMTPPYFVEVGDVMPSALPEPEQERVLAATRAAISALDIRSGWTHTEVKIDRGVPSVMEVGARLGGGYTRDLVLDVYGIDMLAMLVDMHRGSLELPNVTARKAVVGSRLVCKNISFIWRVDELQRVLELPYVRLLGGQSARRVRGACLGVPYSYAGTLLTYFVSGSSPAEALARATEVSARMHWRGLELRLPPALYAAYLRLKRRAQI